MSIEDPRNISTRFGETEAQPAPKLRASESVARMRLGGGGGVADEGVGASAQVAGFESIGAFEAEEAGGDDNPFLKSFGSAFSAPVTMSLESTQSATPARSIFTSSLLPLDTPRLNQPQVAGAIALGGLVAGCAVGAIALGLGGAIITFAFEALAFAGGILVSRAGQKQLQEANEKLLFDASHDSLTGLLNRKTIMDGLEEVAGSSRKSGQPFAVIMCDVDHFKKINDTYGHQAGDDVLRAVAGRLRECLREGSREGRYGGEEFLVVLPEAGTEMAYAAAERVRRAVGGDPVTTAYGTVPVTISLGVASTDRAGTDPQKLLRAADEALYRAKHGGRNRVEVALSPVG